jgi:hypothetical protein
LATATLATARSDDRPTVKVSTTSSASISLDGLLHEPAWRDAAVMKLVQQAPKPGQTTLYETQVQHDAKYGLEVPAAIHFMKITRIQTSFQSPWQNGVAERWVGSCRRELLTTSSL